MSSSASELAGSPDSPNKAIIPINSDVNDPQNDLLSHLHQMTWTRKLEYAGQVLCFAINRETDFIGPVTREASGSGGPATKYPLKFPSRLFVDPFLLDNQEAASLQRKLRSFMSSKVVEMEKNNSLLTKYNVWTFTLPLFLVLICSRTKTRSEILRHRSSISKRLFQMVETLSNRRRENTHFWQ